MHMKSNVKIPRSEKQKMSGRYRITQTDSETGRVLWRSDWIKNLVVNGTNTGVAIVANRIAGVLTYDLEITKCKIGTGTTPPANGDTDLETPTFTKNSVALRSVAGNVVSLSFYLNTTELANGTYTEFGIFAGNQLFARSIISPSYVKGTNQDTTIEYEITVNNT